MKEGGRVKRQSGEDRNTAKWDERRKEGGVMALTEVHCRNLLRSLLGPQALSLGSAHVVPLLSLLFFPNVLSHKDFP